MTVPAESFFDAEFLNELQELASQPGPGSPHGEAAAELDQVLQGFLGPSPDQPEGLTLDAFVALSPPQLAERMNALIELTRSGGTSAAQQSIESFVVFFQTLLPTLTEEGARQVRALFFRLVPTLLQIARHGFGDDAARREEGRGAVTALETVLLEISSVRLSPGESELVFKSIDQMAAFIGIGEYAMATDLLSSQLLSLIRRNKLARALYRLMEAEVAVQRYLQGKLDRRTPWISLPEDDEGLAEYGPIRIFRDALGAHRRLIQVQIPGIADLRHVVLHLASTTGGGEYDFALDGLGAAILDVPDGGYALGLSYDAEA
jgi:hypothetical protein